MGQRPSRRPHGPHGPRLVGRPAPAAGACLLLPARGRMRHCVPAAQLAAVQRQTPPMRHHPCRTPAEGMRLQPPIATLFKRHSSEPSAFVTRSPPRRADPRCSSRTWQVNTLETAGGRTGSQGWQQQSRPGRKAQVWPALPVIQHAEPPAPPPSAPTPPLPPPLPAWLRVGESASVCRRSSCSPCRSCSSTCSSGFRVEKSWLMPGSGLGARR